MCTQFELSGVKIKGGYNYILPPCFIYLLWLGDIFRAGCYKLSRLACSPEMEVCCLQSSKQKKKKVFPPSKANIKCLRQGPGQPHPQHYRKTHPKTCLELHSDFLPIRTAASPISGFC